MEFNLPRTSFKSIKEVIRASYLLDKKHITSTEWANAIAGRNLRENVSRSIAFLKELNLINDGKKRYTYELTDNLLKLGKAIRYKNEGNEIKI